MGDNSGEFICGRGRGKYAGPGDPARAGCDRRRAGHGHRHGLVRASGHHRPVACRARRGDRLRQRPDPAAHRGPHAGHRERLPPVQHVERQLRRVVRVGRPGHQPVPGVPDRVADGGGLHHRHGRGDPAARPLGPCRVRLYLHRHLGVDCHRQRGRRDDADHRRGRYQDHRAGTGEHGAGGIPDPGRDVDLGPGGGARPPSRYLPRSPRAGSACPASAARAARWPGS